jgi:hypothetical protein
MISRPGNDFFLLHMILNLLCLSPSFDLHIHIR